VNDPGKIGKHNGNLELFAGSLGDVPIETDLKILRKKSRDFFWFSPILKRQLQDKIADLVVVPRDETDVMRVSGMAARYRVPITVRGGGTGNYGQCVPVAGGVVLDIGGLDTIEWQHGAMLRVGAGRKMHHIDAETRKSGYELRMHPSTKRMASIGGFAPRGADGKG
jgi:FAD/FMN-containing dehydrogenase